MGKSTVLRTFEACGVSVSSADQIVAEMWSDPVLSRNWAERLELRWPIDKAEVRIRLSDPTFRRRVAEVIHAPVMMRIFELGSQLIEVPLLLEGCLTPFFERIVVVQCHPELQRARLAERLGSLSQADELIRTQLPSTIKQVFADYVIQTDETLDEVQAQVSKILPVLRLDVWNQVA